jgi:MoaA/NifB/PqqE/SkfB family radical SAM enzyme
MTTDEWRVVITDAAALDISEIQFIGGEPSSHPSFTQLLQHAIDVGCKVEIFSNLFHVRPEWWKLYSHPQVTLATSYYSDTAGGHDAVTGRKGSHTRTRANIAEALRRQIAIRVGIIDILDGQRVEQARAELEALGVTDVGIDRIRSVGRAAKAQPDVSQLCGRCGRGKAAISSNGDVWPCVLSRWLPSAGNVKEQTLAEILGGRKMGDLLAMIPARPAAVCNPECKPSQGDGSDCAPAETEACAPAYDDE